MYMYDWDEEKGVASCIIPYNDMIQGVGTAICHPKDEDFKRQTIGEEIAEGRAQIDLLKKVKAFEIIPGIKAMKHVLGTMQHSTHYNEHSYEAKRLKQEIRNSEIYLDSINDIIKDMQEILDNKIVKDDYLFRAIEEHREGQK